MTEKEKIELELLQIIDENSDPQGGILLIEEAVNNLKYIHYKEDEIHFINLKDIEVHNNRKMIKSDLISKSIGNRYKTIITIPYDGRN